MADDLFSPLDVVVHQAMTRHDVPGVAVGILHGERRVSAGYGVTSVENPLPVTAETLFQIGSTTKTITATAVMRLVDEGELELDAPVRQVMPELRLQAADVAESVTVRHLLTHTGGWEGDLFDDQGAGVDALTKYVDAMRSLPQQVPLGTLWTYNNAGFCLAGRIVEKLTGMTFEEAAARLVLQPLGMGRSFFNPADVMTHRFAVGHRRAEETGVVEVMRPFGLGRAINPAGGLMSSVEDQLRYAAFHLGNGSTDAGERLLQPATVAAMQSPHVATDGAVSDHVGLAWLLRDVGKVHLVKHGGAAIGQMSAFVMVPQRRFAITVLTNAERGARLHQEIVAWALDHYLQVRDADPPPDSSLHRDLTPFLGAYENSAVGVHVTADGADLVISQRLFHGFPDRNAAPPPPEPPARCRFYAPDKWIAVDGPSEGRRGDFVRRGGRIIGIRSFGRLHLKK